MHRAICDDCAEREALQKETAMYAKLRDQALLPANLYDLSYGKIQSDIVRSIVKHPLKKTLWLHGPHGTGKTCASLLAALTYVQGGQAAGFVSAMSLASDIREGWRRVHQVRYFPLVILDDLDKVAWNQVSLGALYTLIDTRSMSGTPTIITSQLHPKQWYEGFSKNEKLADSLHVVQAIIDRLHPVTVIELKGTNLRRAEHE